VRRAAVAKHPAAGAKKCPANADEASPGERNKQVNDTATCSARQVARQLEPGPEQPGRLTEQIAAIAYYLSIDAAERRRDPVGCWAAARWHAIPHVRRIAA